MKLLKCARCKVEKPYYEFPDYALEIENHLCFACNKQIYYKQRILQEKIRNEQK